MCFAGLLFSELALNKEEQAKQVLAYTLHCVGQKDKQK